jgi:hypothetical protein
MVRRDEDIACIRWKAIARAGLTPTDRPDVFTQGRQRPFLFFGAFWI